MTDHVSPSIPVFAAREVFDKTRAILAARRHSRRVKALRWTIVLGVILVTLGVVVVAVYDPFKAAIPGLSVDHVALDGTRVTMAHPKLAGYRTDGRPYEIVAVSAVQDLKAPTIFDLHDMDARLTSQDKSITHLTAATGTFDSTREIMDLTSAVRIASDAGLDMHAADAHIDLKSGSVVTSNPVTVVMRGNTVQADSLRIVDSGKQVTFEGHVRSMLMPGTAEGSATLGQKAP